MNILYPKDWKASTVVPPVKDDGMAVKLFIKDLAKADPMDYHKIIYMVNERYVQTKDENYHVTNREIVRCIQEIDIEWHPVVIKDEGEIEEGIVKEV